MRSIRIRHHGEEAEDEDDDAITDTEGVEKDAPHTGDVKGAPDEFVGVPRGAGHLIGVPDRSSDPVPEQEGLGQDVGGVEAADADGDDVVEGGCGTDVYEADGAGNASHDYNCVQWNRRALLDL